jgi:hypothetical protein
MLKAGGRAAFNSSASLVVRSVSTNCIALIRCAAYYCGD